MRRAKVFVNGKYAGLLTEESSQHYLFDYDAAYIQSPFAHKVCLAMPLTKSHYESNSLFPFFSNLLSEGENRQMQARYHHIDETDDFGILLATAQYDTIGCVTIRPIEE